MVQGPPQEVLTAVHAHLLLRAQSVLRAAADAMRVAEAAAVSDGVSVAAIERALTFSGADPNSMEREERELEAVLVAIGAPVQFDQVQVITRTSDEPADLRVARIERAGYFAAVQGRPKDGGGFTRPPDITAWHAGFARFQADLRQWKRRAG